MEITENLANMLRIYKKERRISMTEMAGELEISSSTLQDYLTGQGNPSIKTIEHIAAKMKINPHYLVTDTLSNESIEIIMSLIRSISIVKQLPQEKQQRFVHLFSELLTLWDEE